MKTVGVTGTKVSTSPNTISNGFTWRHISPSVSSAAASFGGEVVRLLLSARYRGGRTVRWEGWQFGMRLAPQALDKFPDWVLNVSHQRVLRVHHDRLAL